MKNPRSLIAYIFCVVLLSYAAFVFFPRWQNKYTEATITWDGSGYYWPLPAFIIYKDVKQMKFSDSIIKKYVPTTGFQQGIPAENSNYVFRYTFGTAIMYFPFFIVAHVLAGPLGYPADGFSEPYQLSVQAGGLIIALVGLWFLRKLFLYYYSDTVVAVLLAVLCIGTNYLNYAAIDNSLPHTWLMTLYVFLILNTRYFYERPSLKYALRIGLLVGLITLVRPPEFISIIIPALWDINSIRFSTFKERLRFIWQHRLLYIVAALGAGLLIFTQLLYWKLVGGHWLIDTYQGQGFSFRHPHFFDYTFAYRSGWLMYTPMMIFAFIGSLLYLWRGQNKLSVLVFFAVSYYIVASWDIWWYAGSGGRAMIQSYAVLLFPVATLIEFVWGRIVLRYIFLACAVAFAYINIWFTYHAHVGGLYDSEFMNERYYKRVIGRWKVPEQVAKLKDHDELYEGELRNREQVFSYDFENDTSLHAPLLVIEGQRSFMLSRQHFGPGWFNFSIPGHNAGWLRAQATFHCMWKEWNMPHWTQLMVRFYREDSVIKERRIFVDRFLADSTRKDIFIDVKLPGQKFDSAGLSIYGEIAFSPIIIDNIKVWTFDEE